MTMDRPGSVYDKLVKFAAESATHLARLGVAPPWQMAVTSKLFNEAVDDAPPSLQAGFARNRNIGSVTLVIDESCTGLGRF